MNWVEQATGLGPVIQQRIFSSLAIIFLLFLARTILVRIIWRRTERYLIEPRKRRGSSQGVWEDILVAFARCDDIDFAYPTQRFYNNAAEGKDGTIKALGK